MVKLLFANSESWYRPFDYCTIDPEPGVVAPMWSWLDQNHAYYREQVLFYKGKVVGVFQTLEVHNQFHNNNSLVPAQLFRFSLLFRVIIILLELWKRQHFQAQVQISRHQFTLWAALGMDRWFLKTTRTALHQSRCLQSQRAVRWHHCQLPHFHSVAIALLIHQKNLKCSRHIINTGYTMIYIYFSLLEQ